MSDEPIAFEKFALVSNDGVFDSSGWWFYCEPCQTHHAFYLKFGSRRSNRPWSFDPKNKSFSPSILVNTVKEDGTPNHCHVTVTNGVLNYLRDSKHPLAGKSFPIKFVEGLL